MRNLALLLATLFALTLSSVAFAEPASQPAPNEPAKDKQPVGDAAKLGTKDDPKALAKKTDHKKDRHARPQEDEQHHRQGPQGGQERARTAASPLSLAIAYQKAAVSEHKNGREVAAIPLLAQGPRVCP
jgi:hypothetical protein